jgi:hypothetical protein
LTDKARNLFNRVILAIACNAIKDIVLGGGGHIITAGDILEKKAHSILF